MSIVLNNSTYEEPTEFSITTQNDSVGTLSVNEKLLALLLNSNRDLLEIAINNTLANIGALKSSNDSFSSSLDASSNTTNFQVTIKPDNFEKDEEIHTKELLRKLDPTNELLPGDETESEKYIKHLLNQYNKVFVMDWLNKLVLSNSQDLSFVAEIIYDLSHIDYKLIYPQGATIACSAFSFEDDYIKEIAIRAFANWNSKDSLSYLPQHEILNPILKDLFERTMDDIAQTGR